MARTLFNASLARGARQDEFHDMEWYEKVGSARPVSLRSQTLPTSLNLAQLSELIDAFRHDEQGSRSGSGKLSGLCMCLYACAKMEREKNEELRQSEELHEFYGMLYTTVETFLTDVPCLRTSRHASETLLYALAFLVDLVKALLSSLNVSSSAARVKDATSAVRSLSKALDRDTCFHQMHQYLPLPSCTLIDCPRRFTSCKSLSTSADVSLSPKKRRKTASAVSINMSNFCTCSDCGFRSPESHLWIKCLVEYFGRYPAGPGANDRGFDCLKGLLPLLDQFPLEFTEAITHLFSRLTEYLREDLRSNLLQPFMRFTHDVTFRCERELDEHNIEIYIKVLKHVRSLLHFFLTVEVGSKFVRNLETQIQQKLVSFMSDGGDSLIESTPVSVMACEEFSSAKSSPPAQRLLERTADWLKFPLQLKWCGQEGTQSVK